MLKYPFKEALRRTFLQDPNPAVRKLARNLVENNTEAVPGSLAQAKRYFATIFTNIRSRKIDSYLEQPDAAYQVTDMAGVQAYGESVHDFIDPYLPDSDALHSALVTCLTNGQPLLPMLENQLASPDWLVRAVALFILSDMPTPDDSINEKTVSRLIVALEADPDVRIRMLSAGWLALLFRQGNVEDALLRVLMNEKIYAVKGFTIWGVGRLGDSTLADKLAELWGKGTIDTDADIGIALNYLATNGIDGATAALFKALNSSVPTARAVAIIMLSSLGENDVGPRQLQKKVFQMRSRG